MPSFSKHRGELCGGSQIHVTDPSRFRPGVTTLRILETARRLYPGRLTFQGPTFDRLLGTASVRPLLESGGDLAPVLARLVGSILGLRNGASLVMTAFGGTAAIFVAMAMLAGVVKRELSGLGKMLTVGALVVFVAMLANFFLQSSALMLALLVLCLGIFSAFILVDLKRVIDGGETNYISATLAVYMDVFNVFQSLLALLGIFGGERD